MANTKCGHPSCNCPASASQKFCSDACRELASAQGRQLRCDCGHKDCVANA